MLRHYQLLGIERIQKAWVNGSNRVLAVAPTGAGKGTMAVALIERYVRDRKKSIFVVHRVDIVDDIRRRLFKLGIDSGAIISGVSSNPCCLVQVGTVQTLVNRDVGSFDLSVFDEAHHYAAKQWADVISKNGESRIVGFTATPERADGKPLGDSFSSLVNVVSYSKLMHDGHIVPCDVYRPRHILESRTQAQGALRAYMEHSYGERAFCFTNTVLEAKQIAHDFCESGVKARVIHAKTPKRERRDSIRDLGNGDIKVVVNVFTMTEGVDIPAVSTIILTKACDHQSTYMQMTGRALRPYKNKTRAKVLDLAGTSFKHGSPTEDRLFNLNGTAISRLCEADRDIPGNMRTVYSVVNAEIVNAGDGDIRRLGLKNRINYLASKGEMSAGWAPSVMREF